MNTNTTTTRTYSSSMNTYDMRYAALKVNFCRLLVWAGENELGMLRIAGACLTGIAICSAALLLG